MMRMPIWGQCNRAYLDGRRSGRNDCLSEMIKCAKDWAASGQSLAQWIEHAERRHTEKVGHGHGPATQGA